MLGDTYLYLYLYLSILALQRADAEVVVIQVYRHFSLKRAHRKIGLAVLHRCLPGFVTVTPGL